MYTERSGSTDELTLNICLFDKRAVVSLLSVPLFPSLHRPLLFHFLEFSTSHFSFNLSSMYSDSSSLTFVLPFYILICPLSFLAFFSFVFFPFRVTVLILPLVLLSFLPSFLFLSSLLPFHSFHASFFFNPSFHSFFLPFFGELHSILPFFFLPCLLLSNSL